MSQIFRTWCCISPVFWCREDLRRWMNKSLSERRSLQGPLEIEACSWCRNHTQLKIPETPIGGAEGDSTILPLWEWEYCQLCKMMQDGCVAKCWVSSNCWSMEAMMINHEPCNHVFTSEKWDCNQPKWGCNVEWSGFIQILMGEGYEFWPSGYPVCEIWWLSIIPHKKNSNLEIFGGCTPFSDTPKSHVARCIHMYNYVHIYI